LEVKGFVHAPDAVAELYVVNGTNYLLRPMKVMQREYGSYADGGLAKLSLDPIAFPDALVLQADTKMGD
jgi:hypothetical protein